MKGLLHIVHFWLKNPNSEEDRDALIQGLKTLADVPSITSLHIGVPASTVEREVQDNSFDVAEVMVFEDMQGHDLYQHHPLHHEFVENCSHLWKKVVVRDSVSV